MLQHEEPKHWQHFYDYDCDVAAKYFRIRPLVHINNRAHSV